MKIDRARFIDILQQVLPGIGTEKSHVDQTLCFVFKGNEVMTFNDEVAVSYPLCEDDGFEITGAVLAKELLALARKIKSKEITIELTESEFIIAGKRSEAGIRLERDIRLPIEEMPAPQKWAKLQKPKEFVEAIKTCIFSASTNLAYPILCCLHLSSLGIESCDRFRLTRFSFDTGIQKSCLLPAWVAKHLPKYDPQKVSIDDGWIHFKNKGGIIFSSRLYDGEFPEIDHFFDQKGQEIEFPEDIVEVIDRASVLAQDVDGSTAITIEIKGKKLIIKSEGKNGWFQETILLKTSLKDFSFSIDPAYFHQILTMERRAMVTDTAILFENEKFKHLISLFAKSKKT